MTETEALVPICMIGILFGMMTLVSLWVYKRNVNSDFILRKRLTRINWRKVIKWYVYIQIFLLLLKTSNQSTWVITVATPVIIIGLLLISFFFAMDNKDDTKDLESKEFKDFSRAYERDRKLDKILK